MECFPLAALHFGYSATSQGAVSRSRGLQDLLGLNPVLLFPNFDMQQVRDFFGP